MGKYIPMMTIAQCKYLAIHAYVAARNLTGSALYLQNIKLRIAYTGTHGIHAEYKAVHCLYGHSGYTCRIQSSALPIRALRVYLQNIKQRIAYTGTQGIKTTSITIYFSLHELISGNTNMLHSV